MWQLEILNYICGSHNISIGQWLSIVSTVQSVSLHWFIMAYTIQITFTLQNHVRIR